MNQPDDSAWNQNYFNYFTEIEEYFRRARGTSLFLLSPLDWALIENWKTAGIPLEAVQKGIDKAFEKWRARKSRHRAINSLAYCAQTVLEAAQQTPRSRERKTTDSPFSSEDIRKHLNQATLSIRNSGVSALGEIAAGLGVLEREAESYTRNLEALEQKLTSLEEKMVAITRSRQSDEDLLAIRQELDGELKPYRGKMTADQISMLERRYLDTALLERAKLPRLSLFYLH